MKLGDSLPVYAFYQNGNFLDISHRIKGEARFDTFTDDSITQSVSPFLFIFL